MIAEPELTQVEASALSNIQNRIRSIVRHAQRSPRFYLVDVNSTNHPLTLYFQCVVEYDDLADISEDVAVELERIFDLAEIIWKQITKFVEPNVETITPHELRGFLKLLSRAQEVGFVGELKDDFRRRLVMRRLEVE